MVKGGFSVDVGVRAFMPASRSGAREAADMRETGRAGDPLPHHQTGYRRGGRGGGPPRHLEDEEREAKEKRYAEVKEGDTVTGTVRSLTDFGAFVDIGGVDALLHVAEISWGRVNKPADVLNRARKWKPRY